MIHHLRITVLMEHRSLRDELATEHGFSLWIEADDTNILFDAGQTSAFAENAKALGIDLSSADFIVLSHGHYDHTGGLEAALEAAPRAQICLHPEAGLPRFSHPPGLPMRTIGMAFSTRNALQTRSVQACSQPEQIRKGIWITGPIPRLHPIEHPQQAFSRDEQGLEPDLFQDDLALVIQSISGNVILTGCCHAGVANTLQQARRITGDNRCVLLAGGLHLVRANEDQVLSVLDTLREVDVQTVLSGHCTGCEAENVLGAIRRQTGPGPLKGLLKVGSIWEMGPEGIARLDPRG